MATMQPTPSTHAVTDFGTSALFTNIHKSIRHGLADTLARLGAADLEEEAQAATVTDDLLDLLDYCERHLEHEEHIVRPALEGRLVPEAFDRGHPAHLRMIAELRALVRALHDAPPRQRRPIGHSLYLHFSVFAGDCLEHMAEEERVLLPLLQRTFGESALQSIHQRILNSLTPAERARAARRMLPAVDAVTRREMTLGMLAQAPREAVLGLLESLRPALGASAFNELVDLVAPVASAG
jgi:hemerythrin-like domain-containing protein